MKAKLEVGSRKLEGKRGPNEHGVLPVTEFLRVETLMPRGCQALIRLSLHDGLWYYGLDLRGPGPDFRGESFAPNVSSAKWASRTACLAAAIEAAKRFFAGNEDAVLALKAFAIKHGEDDGPAGSGFPLPASGFASTSFRGARAPLSLKPNLTPVPTRMSKPSVALHKRPLVHRPLKELTIHPAIVDDPRMAPKDPRYLAMKTAWAEQGGCPPIYVTASGQIVDGRHRYWWLQDEDEDTAPCIEVSEDEVPTIILSALIGRNHITKGQRAYLAAPKLEQAFAAAQERRLEIMRSGGKKRLAEVPDMEALAEKMHISPELLRQARKLHEAFADPRKFVTQDKKKTTLRAYFEPQILSDDEPMSLGDALKGVGYFLANSTEEGNRKPNTGRNSSLRNFVVGWRNLVKPAAAWEKWDADTQELAVDGLREALTKMPAPVLDAVTAALRQARKAQATAAAEPAAAE